MQDLIENLTDCDDDTGRPITTGLEKLCDDDRSYLFAAIVNYKVVGYALSYRFPSLFSKSSLAYLYDIEVLESHRRKGVGKLLKTSMLAKLKTDEVKELRLGTAINNAEGQALFRATGAEKSTETFNDFTYYLSR